MISKLENLKSLRQQLDPNHEQVKLTYQPQLKDFRALGKIKAKINKNRLILEINHKQSCLPVTLKQ